jgi:hypothetical protein
MDEQPDLLDRAKAVLAENDRGTHTVPAEGLYPHQWLWDSCFIAIGLRHLDIDRAQAEILSLLGGQWSNGMLPNMILSHQIFARDRNIWRSWLNPYAPDHVNTSGITQPPVLAEAIVQIGAKMKKPERRTWYQTVYPALLAYHEWLYAERDPHSEGLVLQIHPWECGLDNTPPWMQELHEHQLAWWIRVVEKLHIESLFNIFRRDTRYVPAEQRLNIIDALALYSTQRRLRRKGYDIKKILSHSLFAIEDVNFNSIFIRANQHLVEIAKTIRKDLPEELVARMKNTEEAFEQLWDPYSSQYYSREFITHRLIKIPSIGALMPLYSGGISEERAKQLVRLLEDEHQFGTPYPIPSTPVNSEWFHQLAYWQGPTWVNTNWMIIDGLKRYGFDDHAAALTESTLELVERAGCYEYFSPIDGHPAGTPNFSWTAALTIDLLKTK